MTRTKEIVVIMALDSTRRVREEVTVFDIDKLSLYFLLAFVGKAIPNMITAYIANI